MAVCMRLGTPLKHRCPQETGLSEDLFFPRGTDQEVYGDTFHLRDRRGLGGTQDRQQPGGELFWGSRGGRGPIPQLPEDAVSSCVRRTKMSVQCAGTAGSSSAVTAAPGPSTWPACPRHSGRFPGEPPQHPSTATRLHGGLYPLTLSGRLPRSLSCPRMGGEAGGGGERLACFRSLGRGAGAWTPSVLPPSVATLSPAPWPAGP